MIRTWKCLLGAWAVCAIFSQTGYSQVVEIDSLGVARTQPPANAPRPADYLYSNAEAVWLNDFQPPPGIGVDPVTIPNDNSVGYAVTNDVAQILYRISRVNRHYHGLEDDGFTSAGAFIPVQIFDGGNALFAVDPRAFVSDNGRGGINAGFTMRRFSPRLQRVFVLSNWFDYDRVGRAGYSQYGLHLATIGQYWSLRSNVNLPVGESHHVFNTTTTPAFFGDQITLTTIGRIEDAYEQYDAEFAIPVPYFARFGFEFGIGYYYLNGAREGARDGSGVSTRLEAQITEDLWANALVTSDGVFGSNLSLNFEVTLPNGAPSRILRRLPVKQYLVASDRRPYRVLRDVSRFTTRSSAVSTAECFAGGPIRVAHIDPDAAAGGDGTFERPFNSIAAFQALDDAQQSQYEIILVHARDDDSDTNLNTTITLFDCQRLLGAGIAHNFTATQGTFVLPAVLDATSPRLTNSAAPGQAVVTLADHNEVSGFLIDASGGSGDPTDPGAAVAINGLDLNPFDAGDPTGVRDFNINRNTIENATLGIQITTETGLLLQTGRITENIIRSTSDDAIQINASGNALLALFVDDNEISGGGAIVGLDFLIDGNTFGQPWVITNTSIAGFDITGFILDLTNANAIWDSVEPGASIPFQPLNQSDVLTGLVSVNGTLITPGTNPLQDDQGAVLPGGGVPDDQPILDLAFNNFNPGETFTWQLDVDFVGQPASTVLGSDLIGSEITVNFTNNLFITGSLAPVVGNPVASAFVATGGNIVVGDGDGIEVNLAGNAQIVAGSSISRNTLSGIARDGIRINGPGSASAVLNISDNAITGAGRHGMNFTTRDSEFIIISGSGNSVIGSGGDGLHMETYNSSLLSVAFANSQFDTNTGRGVKGLSFHSSTLDFALTSPGDPRSSASNNGGPGIQFDAAGSSTQNILIDDVLVDPNLDAGILIGAAQNSIVNVEISNSEIINTEDGPDPDLLGDGVVLRSTDNGTLIALVADNLINGNQGNGVRALATGSSKLNFELIGNEITENGAIDTGDTGGILIVRSGNSSISGSIEDNIVDSNSGHGLHARSSGGTAGTSPDVFLAILRNEFTNSNDPDDVAVAEGMVFETFGSSIMRVEAIGNLIDNSEGNGVRVTTNGGSTFGMPSSIAGEIGFPSVFDSNTVTNNGNNDTVLGAGFLFQTNDFSTLIVDVTSIEAALDPDTYSPTYIAGNWDGIRAEHRGLEAVTDQAITSIRIGSAFSFPDPDVFDVVIENNSDEAIDINILNPGGLDPLGNIIAGGIFNMNVSDTLIRGSRAAGSLGDPGVSIRYDGTPETTPLPSNLINNNTIATIVFGSDISDAPAGRGPVRDPVGGAFNNVPYARAGVIITDVAGDGVNVVYNDANEFGSQLNLRFFNSIVGASQFGFNTGDGLDILVHNAGSSSGLSGLDVIVDNTSISGNGGDGIRIRTEAAFANAGEQAFLSGRLVNIAEPNLTDSDGDGTGDTIFDGPHPTTGDNTSDLFLVSQDFVLDPPFVDDGWADLESPDDFVVDLQIINGSRIDNNGGDGVRLDIGTATRQRLSLQNSSFSGNGRFEINVTTFASFETSTIGEADRGQPDEVDTIRLDPTAKLDLFFGSLGFVRNTPAGFPEPGPTVPAEFAVAIGGEGFNTSSSTRVNIEYISSFANGFQVDSIFKGAPRPTSLYISALIPEDDPVIDDVDVPLPNRFLNAGAVFDEILFFTGSLPGGQTSARYLNLNTP